jgi:hypothetical protein
MDLSYLRIRRDVSLDKAEHAASEPARRAHAGLARLYAERIADGEAAALPEIGAAPLR